MSGQHDQHPDLVRTDHGAVRVLRIDREHKLGALSSELVAALGRQVREFELDSAARVLVLTGTGRGFVAGADLGEYHGVSRAKFVEYQHRSRVVFDALAALPKPTIAAVNGYAFGGGFEIALCCDVILAAESARFALPEVKLGLIPGGGGTQRLTRTAGPRFAADVGISGRTVRPDEAERRGIVREVVANERLLDRALEIAAELARLAPIAQREIKRLVAAVEHTPLDVGLTDEQDTLARVFATSDADEGIAAFVEKRAPEFTGR